MNWLKQEFDRARKRSAQLPPFGRPTYRNRAVNTTRIDEPAPPDIRRTRINIPGDGRVRLTRIMFDPSGDYKTSEVEVTLKGTDLPVNSTKIFEPDEQDTNHFRMATWYGPHDSPSDAVIEDDKIKLRGWENSFEISYGRYDLEFDKEDLAGLKHMLDEYENWLEDRDEE